LARSAVKASRAARAGHHVRRHVIQKLRCIDQLHAGRDEQAAGAAHHQQASHATPLDAAYDRIEAAREVVVQGRIVPARIEGRNDGVRAFHGTGDGV